MSEKKERNINKNIGKISTDKVHYILQKHWTIHKLYHFLIFYFILTSRLMFEIYIKVSMKFKLHIVEFIISYFSWKNVYYIFQHCHLELIYFSLWKWHIYTPIQGSCHLQMTKLKNIYIYWKFDSRSLIKDGTVHYRRDGDNI